MFRFFVCVAADRSSVWTWPLHHRPPLCLHELLSLYWPLKCEDFSGKLESLCFLSNNRCNTMWPLDMYWHIIAALSCGAWKLMNVCFLQPLPCNICVCLFIYLFIVRGFCITVGEKHCQKPAVLTSRHSPRSTMSSALPQQDSSHSIDRPDTASTSVNVP